MKNITTVFTFPLVVAVFIILASTNTHAFAVLVCNFSPVPVGIDNGPELDFETVWIPPAWATGASRFKWDVGDINYWNIQLNIASWWILVQNNQLGSNNGQNTFIVVGEDGVPACRNWIFGIDESWCDSPEQITREETLWVEQCMVTPHLSVPVDCPKQHLITTPDDDGDGVTNCWDNCKATPNAGQQNFDNDDLGDACETDADIDRDGWGNTYDNCPHIPNTHQTNSDGVGDGGDACDADDDNDGVLDTVDNCPIDWNPGQENLLPWDEQGDACDDDDDKDGTLDEYDNCPATQNFDQRDTDGDGIGDSCDGERDGDGIANDYDNCPWSYNPGQENTDGDWMGDACDEDIDNDLVRNDAPDNCPFNVNPDQADLDLDGIGDACDGDLDGDGKANDSDNCPLVANLSQDDTDGDLAGDACDEDDDADGILDAAPDNCPLIPNVYQIDTDSDGQGDACDGDLDGDGVANETDNCPQVANSGQANFDGDPHGDACDSDADADNVIDESDLCLFSALGEPVTSDGCSIEQHVPCEGPMGTSNEWKNRGSYLSASIRVIDSFRKQGLISKQEAKALRRQSNKSECGK